MAYSLTVAGYTFQNPPESYRKQASVGNNPQPAVDKEATSFYQSDSQDLQLVLEGTLALDPPLGEPSDDLAELERLQQIAIEGGKVQVDFDPFFSGTCIIEDDPFRQSEGESSYKFTFTINRDSTDAAAYPARNPPDTGNTFELGSLDLGYDPKSVSQNYERQTEQVKRLRGISRSIDNSGLVPKVRVSGFIDGQGQSDLWAKARANVLAYLSAEFQKGWCLIDSLSIRNSPESPDYLDGLFRYDLEVLIVKDPASGIGDVSSYVDQDVKRSGTYAGGGDSGDSDFSGLEFSVSGGSGSLNDDYLEWDDTTLTLSDNDTNYVYVDDQNSDGYGDVKANQSAFPADSLELYRVETANGEITKMVDVRAILLEDRDYEEGGSDDSTVNGDVYLTVFAGDYEIVSGTVSAWNDTRLLLESNTRNYIWVEDPDVDGSAQVQTNTSGYPDTAEDIRMYRVDTDADSVTNIIDDRPSDIDDSTTDTSDADINLNDTLALSDQQFSFARVLSLDDVLSVQDPSPLPALGLVDLAETIPLNVGKRYLGRTDLQEEVVQVADGGTAVVATGGPSITSEFHYWATDFDWNRNVSENGWVHNDTDIISADKFTEGFEDGSLDGWNNLGSKTTADSNNAYSGAYSLYSGDYTGGNAPVPFGTWIPPGYSGGQTPDEIEFWWKETTAQYGAGIRVMNSNGNEEFGFASDNPEWDASDGNSASGSLREVSSFSNDEYDKWVHVRFHNLDWANGTFDLEIEDTTGSYAEYTEAGIPMRNGVDVEQIRLEGQNQESWGDTTVEMWYDDIRVQAAGGAFFTTYTQSFSEPCQPDLQNLDYTLNGATVDLNVIGSPGTADEEIQTATLDGSSGFVLAWGSNHQDFRIQAELVDANLPDQPTITRLELAGDTGGSGGEVSTVWETEFDWEKSSIIDELGYALGDLYLEVQEDDFDSYPTGSTPPETWTVTKSNGVVSDTRSWSGSNSWEFTTDYSGFSSNSKNVLAYTEEPHTRKHQRFEFTYWETSGNTATGAVLLDDQGREIIAFGTANPQAKAYNGNTFTLGVGSNSVADPDIEPDYQEWRQFRVFINWANKEVDVVWEDLTGSSDDLILEENGIPFNNGNATNVSRVELGADDRYLNAGSDGQTHIYFDDVTGKEVTSGSITTEWKWFSEPTVAGFLELVNCNYDLNGESATITVESDNTGDGTVDETSDPISLDGTDQFDVTGIATDSDRFRLVIDLSTTSINSPFIRSITLQGNAGSSDSDQNPSTTWNIIGGKYDTSGNEYEGGGMVVTYGQ